MKKWSRYYAAILSLTCFLLPTIVAASQLYIENPTKNCMGFNLILEMGGDGKSTFLHIPPGYDQMVGTFGYVYGLEYYLGEPLRCPDDSGRMEGRWEISDHRLECLKMVVSERMGGAKVTVGPCD